MSTLDDYVGRVFDLGILCCPVEGRTVLLDQSIFPDEGVRAVTGIQKLAQRFMTELMTIQGSVLLSSRGSGFMSDVRAGYIRLPADALASFGRAMLVISRALLDEESDQDPDDERFVSAEIEQVAVFGGRMVLVIRITSRAGTSRNYLAPIPVLPGGDDR